MNKASFDLQAALDLALRAADAGAEIAMRKHTSVKTLRVQEKEAADFVTDVDRASQEIIIDLIRRVFPDHRILAEEDGADGIGDPASPYRWIIDPLDGTAPFIHGKPDFGCIVALQYQDQTIVGAMTLPELNERFWGAKNLGAFFNGMQVTALRKTKNMHDAILCTNFRRQEGPLVRVPLCASLQNYGCAAKEIGDIIKGQNDGVFFNGVRAWDIAAGFLFVEEAGGKAYWEFKDPNNPRDGVRAVASTAPIFEELRAFAFGS